MMAAKNPLSVLLLGIMVLFSGLVFAQEVPATTEVTPWERQPYDVRLFIAFDTSRFDAGTTQAIIREVNQIAERCAGQLWKFNTAEISWLGPVTVRALERLDRSLLTRHDPDASPDVWFVCTVESMTVGTRVSVRSWQPEVQLETVTSSVELQDRRDIPVTVLRLCRDLMRPIGIVENVTKQAAQIRLRAGEITPPDPTFIQLKPGDLFLPMFAYRNKQKVIERLQTIPWTYISVDEIENSTIMGTVRSGIRATMGGKKNARIDTLVVGVRPQHPSTELELMTQGRTPLPLIAHRIEVRTSNVLPPSLKENPEADQTETLLQELLTDRRGMAHLNIDHEHLLVWLFAYSGEHLLVRIPCVPGLASSLRLDVPDDSARLTAEADLQMLQGEVIDAVALRNTAISTIRAAAKKDDWTTVNQKLALLKRQQAASVMTDRLIAVRVAGTTAAKARKDRAAEVRINRICNDTEALINAHLSDDKVRVLTEEMESLQSAQQAVEEQPKKPGSFRKKK